eukprot:scaffold32409_cov112-Isochrysis_galbana.AAC.3
MAPRWNPADGASRAMGAAAGSRNSPTDANVDTSAEPLLDQSKSEATGASSESEALRKPRASPNRRSSKSGRVLRAAPSRDWRGGGGEPPVREAMDSAGASEKTMKAGPPPPEKVTVPPSPVATLVLVLV